MKDTKTLPSTPSPLFPTFTQQYNLFNIYMKPYHYIILDFPRAKMTTILVNACLRVLQKILNFSTWLLFQPKNLEKLACNWFSAGLLFALGNKFTQKPLRYLAVFSGIVLKYPIHTPQLMMGL